MLSVENIFFIPHNMREKANRARAKFASPDGDHTLLLNVWRAWKVKLSSFLGIPFFLSPTEECRGVPADMGPVPFWNGLELYVLKVRVSHPVRKSIRA